MKASELRAQLLGNMDPEAIDALVKARIADGGVEDDEAAVQTPEVDPSLVDAHVDSIRKALGEYEAPEDFGGQASLFDDLDYAGTPAEGEGTEALVKAMAFSTDEIVARNKSMVKALSNGIVGLAEQNAELTKAVNTLSQLTGAVTGRLDAIEKAVKQPMTPRSLLNMYEPVPSPADRAGESGGMDKAALQTKYEGKALDEMRKAKSAGDATRVEVLRKAVAEFSELGSDPTAIATKYGLA